MNVAAEIRKYTNRNGVDIRLEADGTNDSVELFIPRLITRGDLLVMKILQRHT